MTADRRTSRRRLSFEPSSIRCAFRVRSTPVFPEINACIGHVSAIIIALNEHVRDRPSHSGPGLPFALLFAASPATSQSMIAKLTVGPRRQRKAVAGRNNGTMPAHANVRRSLKANAAVSVVCCEKRHSRGAVQIRLWRSQKSALIQAMIRS